MESKSKHVIDLAKEIIDNIELSEIDAQSILLKTTRLARYADAVEIREWLKMEMQGFPSNNPTAEKYMTKTGRWINYDEKKGSWIPLAQIDASIKSQAEKIKQLRIPDANYAAANVAINNIMNALHAVSTEISRLSGIRSRVISLLHDFATTVYYERIFDNLAESIFEEYKKEIDLLIAKNSGDILDQIPSVIARLSDSDKESISQALTTCRRIIDSFANHIYPPSDIPIMLGGNEISLKADKVLNRINAYVSQRCESESRRNKIRQNLKNLYERSSAGVHSDVDAQEARNLFFNVYLLLGEILKLDAK
ncbi:MULTISPECIES: AbiTii domain-containing protein [unclassified Chitinophaga]|uniref:AbiTii domain-containing protein n=1 Tax=unclassified Chitinophaga TaxID=2619133 RepID=UPI00300FA969